MSRIEAFLNMINEKFCNSSNLEELQELWKSTEEEKTICEFIFTSGKQKDKKCGKENCLTHIKTELCKFIMKSGLRKGQVCDKNCKSHPTLCELHKKFEVKNKEKDEDKAKDEKDKETDQKDDAKESKDEKANNKVKDEKEKDEKVKDEKVKDEKEDKVKDKAKETCKMILKTGVNKGKECGKKTNGMYCSIHDKKEDKEKIDKEKKSKKKCHVETKQNGEDSICGRDCEPGKETCSQHETIRVKKFGNRYIIKGTNVLFDIETKNVIGYVKDDECIFKKNDEVQQVCEQYHIEYEEMK